MINEYKTNKFAGQWAVLLLALLLLAGLVIHNLYSGYQNVMTGEKQRLLTQVRVVSANLAEQLTSTDFLLRNFQQEFGARYANNWFSDEKNRKLEILADTFTGIRSLVIIDASGIIRLSNWKDVIGKDISQRNYFQSALNRPDPSVLFISKPFKTLLGAWGINLVRVIPDSKGDFAGIVVATLDVKFFKTILSSINYAPDMWSSIIHGEGELFIMAPESRPGVEINLATPGSFFTSHLESKKTESVIIDKAYYTDDQRIIAIYTMQPQSLKMDKPLVIMASRNLDVIFEAWNKDALYYGVIFLIIASVSIVALIGFQKYQRRQMQQNLIAEQSLLDAKQQLNSIVEFLPDPTFVIDQHKRVVIWNKAIEKMSGVPKEEMLGKGDHEYTIPFYGIRREQLLDLFDVDNQQLAIKYANIRRDGEILNAETFCPALDNGKGRHVWVIGVPLYDFAGKRVGAIESIRDISELKKAEEFLRKLSHGLEHSASAVLITDIHGIVEYVNLKFIQLTGYSSSEIIGQNPRILKSDVTPRKVYEELWQTILSGKEWRGELLNRRKSGEVYWSITSISPLKNDEDQITHFIANVEDINERKNAEVTIERLAYYDPLTELPNRRMLQGRLELALKRSQRQGSIAALLYLDLDNFKHVNDSLGHPAGDNLLREMSSRITRSLRDDDVVCRLGGDEFAVILHDVRHNQDVAQVIQYLMETMSEPMALEGCEVVVTSSVGIALFPKDGSDGNTLEKHADIALYHAKSEGRNTFRFFSEELNSSLRDRIAMEQGLRHALKQNELELLYQPKVSISTGRVTGVEALLRWNSPEFGTVSPLRFIPIAEETRQIIPIGEWVLHHACIQQLEWEKQGLGLSMAVNLSAVQFKAPELIERISAIIDESGIRPENLELELTESALVEKPDEVVRVLESLRSLGCSISIDDFGTGYSSLSYLKAFPVTILKIDRSFVRDLSHNSGDRAIAQSVVNLATNLDMLTVAEGVETNEQYKILKQIGCTYIQGYLYSRPLHADQIPAVVEKIQREQLEV